jgi:hypothetical protein
MFPFIPYCQLLFSLYVSFFWPTNSYFGNVSHRYTHYTDLLKRWQFCKDSVSYKFHLYLILCYESLLTYDSSSELQMTLLSVVSSVVTVGFGRFVVFPPRIFTTHLHHYKHQHYIYRQFLHHQNYQYHHQ